MPESLVLSILKEYEMEMRSFRAVSLNIYFFMNSFCNGTKPSKKWRNCSIKSLLIVDISTKLHVRFSCIYSY